MFISLFTLFVDDKKLNMLRSLIIALMLLVVVPSYAQRKKKKGADKVSSTKVFKMPKTLMKLSRVVGADQQAVYGISAKARQTTGSLINNLVNLAIKSTVNLTIDDNEYHGYGSWKDMKYFLNYSQNIFYYHKEFLLFFLFWILIFAEENQEALLFQ